MIQKFRNWAPIRIYWREGQPFVDWCYMGSERYTEPFYYLTTEGKLRQPFNVLFRHQTPLEFLGELYEQAPGLAPTGFIFHMSRCGSTLVSQMLASVERNLVISEPPPIDSVLRANIVSTSVTDEQRIEWLKWIVGALGQDRNGEKYYFIKFDSWSAIDLDLIRRAFPEVPWVFLYRNPVEVIVSHMRLRGAQMIPGLSGKCCPAWNWMKLCTRPRKNIALASWRKFAGTALNCAQTSNAPR